ncbi:poly(ethylene terephthalate) hydrolase family protein [Salinarimonas soli]|uniref:Alpha/beta hydrolase n=1 Tax=Salinarimonas soli TaxID=1638099 RepID=A0A5B2VQY3_9HYPH|nr:alpha/beta hydrolase [Salinarimonas soli]KAA2241078.1 alpha/beta hydrolase [Salinarimonas soli]
MRRTIFIALALTAILAAPPAFAAKPPDQAQSGPGGTDYVTKDVAKRALGRASAPIYVFHPAEAAAEPRPVIVFLHAWGANNPAIYGGWIEHLARKGNLVLFPRYQDVNRTRPADATANAVQMTKEAFAALASDANARPDLERVVYMGHLAGAAVAANLAAAAPETQGLPRPKLYFGLMPGGIASDAKERGIMLEALDKIDDALMVTMIGDRDHIPSDRAARRIHRGASGVALERKAFLRILSDDHGFPPVSATLASPGSYNAAYDGTKLQAPPDPPRDPKGQRWKWSADMALTGPQTVISQQLASNATDVLDYNGFWKTLDLAMQTAFANGDGMTLRRIPALFEMGRWSDGWPVRRITADNLKPEPPAASRPPSAAAAPAGKR